MSLLDTVVNLKAVEFNLKRRLFPPSEGTTVYFLQPDGMLKNYKLTDSRPGMTTGWYVEMDKLKIATTEANFHLVIEKSACVAIGTHIFSIDKGSAKRPSEKYPHYTIAIEANGETYVP